MSLDRVNPSNEIGLCEAAEVAPISKLRFETIPFPDESIPGVVARGVSEHVLHHIGMAFDAAGVTCSRPGLSQLLPREDLDRLAVMLQCEPEALSALAGTRSLLEGSKSHQRVQFGDLTVLRANLDLRKRRISPISLQTANYHRVAWLNRLLPYCPESLERLVDVCGHCSSPLEWLRTWGVAVCETCDQEVPASTEAPLPAGLADGYRLFASLMSPLASQRMAARSSLPARLQEESYATLVRLASRIGLVMSDENVANFGQYLLRDMPPADLASVLSTGAEFLFDWPVSFKAAVQARTDALRSDLRAFHKWRLIMRRLGTEKLEGPEQARLILEVFPDLHATFARSFASPEAFYLSHEASQIMGVSNRKLNDAIEAGALELTELPGVRRRRVQLSARHVDHVAQLLRSSPMINSLPGALGLPHYGVEQMVAYDLLEWEPDPAVCVIREWPCLKPVSVETFFITLGAALSTTDAPGDAIPLANASRFIGGREKPWGAVIAAICSGDLPAWRSGPNLDTRDIIVRPDDLKRFNNIEFEPPPTDFPYSRTISKYDCAELLNISSRSVQIVESDLRLAFARSGRADIIDKSAVIDIAQLMASPAEIGRHLGISSWDVACHMKQLGVQKISVGWDRAQLTMMELLPPIRMRVPYPSS